MTDRCECEAGECDQLPNCRHTDDAKLEQIAEAIYEEWWNGTEHVCAYHRCPDCLANARVAAVFFFERVSPWTLEVGDPVGVVENPEAIGDPSQTPVLNLSRRTP